MKSNKLKRALSAVTATGMLVSALTFSAAAADETVPAETNTAVTAAEQPAVASVLRVSGTVEETADGSILLKMDENSQYTDESVLIKIYDSTKVLDAKEGIAANITDVKKGDFVIAYISAVMTRSLPPQSNAEVVFTNAADAPAFTYTKVVSADQTDKGYTIGTDQDVILTVTDETAILPYATKNIVTAQDITKGSMIVAWYDIMSASIPAYATPSRIVLLASEDEKPEEQEEDNGDIEGLALATRRVYGKVAEIGEASLTLKNDDKDDPYQEVVIHVSDETKIVDSMTGMPSIFANLKEGDSLEAYIGPAVTMSLPPQSTASVIFTEPAADAAFPQYGVVTEVEKNEDGTCAVTTDQEVTFTMNADTEFAPFLTKNIVTAEDVTKGDQIAIWYTAAPDDDVTPVAAKVVILVDEEDEPADIDDAPAVSVTVDGITVKGEAVALTEAEKPYEANGVIMAPLRKFAEALGCDVHWNGETIEITVKNADTVLYVIKGNTNQVSQTESMTELSQTAVITEAGVTFVAAEDLLKLHQVVK